jgi:hypothetical protein
MRRCLDFWARVEGRYVIFVHFRVLICIPVMKKRREINRNGEHDHISLSKEEQQRQRISPPSENEM